MRPIQLMINGVRLPTQTRDRYQSYPVELRETLEMIAGNSVDEVRGIVQKIVWSCDAMPDQQYREVLAALRSAGPKTVTYLPDDGDELVTSRFNVESISNPTLFFFEGKNPKWHNFGFVLREVDPHA